MIGVRTEKSSSLIWTALAVSKTVAIGIMIDFILFITLNKKMMLFKAI